MARHTCTDCHQPIAAGEAVLRGNGHELRAWHRGCWTGDVVVRSSRPTLAEPSDAECALAA